MGRYAYRHQPNMIEYAIRKLGEALAETIGAEIQYDGVQEGWAKGKDHKDLRELREKGLAFVDEIISEYKDVFKKEYLRLFAKVGLFTFSSCCIGFSLFTKALRLS